MFISPLVAAIVIGSFWTGVGVTAAQHDGLFAHHAATSDVVISATTVDHDAHWQACAARYRSYDGDRDMYLGFDGSWHLCRL